MGHPTSLFLTTPDPNLRCAICLDIFSHPVSLLSCSHTFCSDCLATCVNATTKKNPPCCPECRVLIEDDPHKVRVIESTIQNLVVRCKNAYLDEDCNSEDYCPQECGWTGPLSEWSLHAARECAVEIVQCVCGYNCPRGQMGGHVGSKECVERAVDKRVAPVQKELEAAKQREEGYKSTIEKLVSERDDLQSRVQDELDQNRMLTEQNTWLRHTKDSAKKASLNKIQRLKREKKELMSQLAVMEGRVKNNGVDRSGNGSGKKRRRSASKDGRIRAVSNGHELEVHAIVG
ncbi:hypothetical protein ACHAWO_013822 [Cyclotella atomus]|uniref:RING-type domain-containing protein n=1 Tax=Cyclotella atomus TaxID=382360 RepID=A0ABD3QIG2_9STRA